MTVMKEEDPESGFSRERFLKAIEASEVKLNQKKQFRQEREAEISSASEPVANKAFEDKKLIKETKSAGRFTKSKESDIGFPAWAESRMANHRKSKGNSFPQVNFKTNTESTLRKISPIPPCCKTPL